MIIQQAAQSRFAGLSCLFFEGVSMLPTILYVVLSVLVAFIGTGKRGGFLLHLVICLALTPVAGIITVLIAPDAQKDSKDKGGQ